MPYSLARAEGAVRWGRSALLSIRLVELRFEDRVRVPCTASSSDFAAFHCVLA